MIKRLISYSVKSIQFSELSRVSVKANLTKKQNDIRNELYLEVRLRDLVFDKIIVPSKIPNMFVPLERDTLYISITLKLSLLKRACKCWRRNVR